MTSCYVTSWNKAWQFGRLISFTNANISLGAQLGYKIYPITFYREWPNHNTAKISFSKVAVLFVKFAIEYLKMT